MATTTLTGTTGNNLLNAPGSVSTLVQGLQGNDTINLALAADEAQGGQGFDQIEIIRGGVVNNIIDGGEQGDTISIRSAAAFQGSVYAGAGLDSIRFQNAAGGTLISGAFIATQEGNDTVTLNTAAADTLINTYLGLGQGADLLSDAGGNNLVSTEVYGGKGADTIRFGGVTTGSGNTINGSDGFDRLFLTAANTLTTSLLGGGKGNDSIFFDGTIGTIAGGGLDDTISIFSQLASGQVIFGDAVGTITTGSGTGGAADGADIIGTSANGFAGSATIYGGGGNDTISVRSLTAGLVHGGNGADSITIFSGGATHAGSVFGGNGNDTIQINSAFGRNLATMTTINGGAGVDSIRILGGTAGFLAVSAAGTVLTANSMAVVAYEAGDIISFASTGTVNQTALGNWLVGNASVWVLTGALVDTGIANFGTFLTAVQNGGDGSVAAYSDGQDSWIIYFDTTNSFQSVKVQGADLVLTTRVGQAVALNSSTFGFTLSEANANSSSGLNITLA